MQVLNSSFGAMHIRTEGLADGPAVVFANSLGTDLRLWDALVDLLPAGLHLARFDKRGHGLSAFDGPFSIEDLADDAAALIEATCRRPVVFVGLSVGGLIGQALALRRPDLLRGLVLSNTAARIGTAGMWAQRIAAIEAEGLASIADGIMERWFAPSFRAKGAHAPWRAMMARTLPESYVATCRAIAAADYTDRVGRLDVPTLVIAGEHDVSTPPALVQATAKLIPGARLVTMAGTAHLPCVEDPRAYADLLTDFLQEIGHA